MASRPMLPEDDLSCPVCLKIFEDPAILCCSHSFCRACLDKWWIENIMMECPVCKTRSPSRNPPRNLALKNLCEAFSQQSIQTTSADSEGVCSMHNEKLQLFCLDHLQPVCVVCLHSEEHADHSFKPINEAARQQKAEAQKSLEPLKEKLKALQQAKGHCVKEEAVLKAQAEERERIMDQDFQKLLEDLHKGHDVNIFTLREQVKSKSQEMKERIHAMNRDMEAISKSIRAVEKQLEAPDVVFLQNYKTTVERPQASLAQVPQRPARSQGSRAQVPQQTPGNLKHVTTPTINTTKPLNNENQIMKPTKRSPLTQHGFLASSAEICKLKSHLRKYACKLTLDPDTVNRNLILSEDNRKVSSHCGKQSYPDHPGRFNYYTQVLCREGLTGKCYWEVDWKGNVYVGVTYRGIDRKGADDNRFLGRNNNSWVLECSGERYTARHKSIITPIPFSSTVCLCDRLAVYLDWPAGSLSFYTVSSDTLTHIHTFHETFTEELLPGFWVGYGSSVSLCQMK